MQKLILTLLLISISSPVLAQTTYKTYGSKTFGTDGSRYTTYNNRTYSSDGTTYKQYGNRVQSSNGDVYKQYNNTITKNGEVYAKKYNDTIYFRDSGKKCKTYNNKTYCN